MSGRDGFGGVRFRVADGRVTVGTTSTAPDARVIVAHRQAQAAGERHEAWCRAQHAEALRLGLARIRRVSPHVKVVGAGRRPGTFEGCFDEESGADYVGVVLGDGRHFVAEAKSSLDERLARSQLTGEQIADLDAGAASGGLAVLLWEFRQAGRPPRRFAAPWARVAWKAVGRGRGVGVEEMAAWEVPAGACYVARLVGR